MFGVVTLGARAQWWRAGSHAAPTSAWVAIVMIVVCMGMAFVVALVATRFRGQDDDDHRGGGPGSDPPGPRPHDPEPQGDLELWWPEFERQFAAYVRASGSGRPVQRACSKRTIGDHARHAGICHHPRQ